MQAGGWQRVRDGDFDVRASGLRWDLTRYKYPHPRRDINRERRAAVYPGTRLGARFQALKGDMEDRKTSELELVL